MKNYLIDKETFLKSCAAWKAKPTHSPVGLIIYNVIRSFEPDRGFTPITSKNKLSNGLTAWHAYNRALQSAQCWLKMPQPSKWDSAEQTAIKFKRHKEYIEGFGIPHDAELLQKMYNALEGKSK